MIQKCIYFGSFDLYQQYWVFGKGYTWSFCHHFFNNIGSLAKDTHEAFATAFSTILGLWQRILMKLLPPLFQQYWVFGKGYSWSLCHHFFNNIRSLAKDTNEAFVTTFFNNIGSLAKDTHEAFATTFSTILGLWQRILMKLLSPLFQQYWVFGKGYTWSFCHHCFNNIGSLAKDTHEAFATTFSTILGLWQRILMKLLPPLFQQYWVFGKGYSWSFCHHCFNNIGSLLAKDTHEAFAITFSTILGLWQRILLKCLPSLFQQYWVFGKGYTWSFCHHCFNNIGSLAKDTHEAFATTFSTILGLWQRILLKLLPPLFQQYWVFGKGYAWSFCHHFFNNIGSLAKDTLEAFAITFSKETTFADRNLIP